jgi:hypothetical protein
VPACTDKQRQTAPEVIVYQNAVANMGRVAPSRYNFLHNYLEAPAFSMGEHILHKNVMA